MAFLQCIYIFIHRDPGQNNDLFRSGLYTITPKEFLLRLKCSVLLFRQKIRKRTGIVSMLRHSQFALSVRFLLSKAGCRSKINRIIGYILLGIMPAELHKLNGSGV